MRSSVWTSSVPSYSGRKRISSERSEEPEVSSAALYNALHFAAFCSLSRDICSQTTISKAGLNLRDSSPILPRKSLREKRG